MEEIKRSNRKISGWCLDQGGTIKMTEEIFNNGFDKVNRPNPTTVESTALESIDVIRNFGKSGRVQGSILEMISNIFVDSRRRTGLKI